MSFLLVHLSGANRRRRVPLRRHRTAIGSDITCPVWLRGEEGVAPHHATLVLSGGRVTLERVDEAHPVRLNEEEVVSERVRPGDTIQVGACRFRLVYRSPARRLLTAGLWILVAAAALAAVAVALHPLWPSTRHRRRMATRRPEPVAVASNQAFQVAAPELDRMESASTRLSTADTNTADLAETPPAPPPTPAPPPDDTAEQADRAQRRAKAQAVLDSALSEARAGRVHDAEARLRKLQTTTPDFLPAYAALARLLENGGQPDKAEAQWSALLRHGNGDPIEQEAADALARLARRHMTPEPEPPTVTPPPPTADRNRLRLGDVEPLRFPRKGDYEEMRLLQIPVQTVGPAAPNPALVRVEAEFFDRRPGARRVEHTAAQTSPKNLAVPGGAWTTGETRTVTASYVVPVGLRAEQARRSGDAARYYGYVVRLYYDGVLQDTAARPPELAEP